MSVQAIGSGADSDLQTLAALQVMMQAAAAQQSMAAVQAAVSAGTGGTAAPLVSSSAEAPGSLELFA